MVATVGGPSLSACTMPVSCLPLALLCLLQTPARPVPTGHGGRALPVRSVYLCQGGRSYAYHVSPRCEGLAWCTTPLRRATVAAATKEGRYPCGRCRPASR